MSQTQARLILIQINNLKNNTKLRIKAATLWYEGLKSNKFLILPKLTKNFSHMYWYFPIQYNNRNLLVSHVLNSGNDITESYHRNCANLKCFSEYKRNCPNAEKTANSLIYLPTYPGLNLKHIYSTVSSINSYFK
jgi:dTDP-4-amino-4,6-dideoxygalactose transaminase